MATNKPHYAQVWDKLRYNGFDKGEDIPYIQFCEACEDANFDPDDIDLDDFGDTYGVNIG